MQCHQTCLEVLEQLADHFFDMPYNLMNMFFIYVKGECQMRYAQLSGFSPYVSPSHNVATKTAVQQFHFPSFREIRTSVFWITKVTYKLFYVLLF